MKYRESGMPEEEMWDSFFKSHVILESLELQQYVKNLVDIGCGYGTFLIPASKMISGTAVGIDIDQIYIDICQKRIDDYSLEKTYLIHGDIAESKTMEGIFNLIDGADYVSLFNILHCDEPVKLIENILKFLKAGGKMAVVHWKYGDTPRGLSLDIRPKPETVVQWASKIRLTLKNRLNSLYITTDYYLKSTKREKDL